MKKPTQRKLIRALCNNLKNYMLEKAKDIPEDWDGHELRQWMADLSSEQYNYRHMGRTRKREYNNTRAVRNL